MKSFLGQVIDATEVARYRKRNFQWICKRKGDYYFATFHNGRKSSRTFYSTDYTEINDLIKKQLLDGYKKVR